MADRTASTPIEDLLPLTPASFHILLVHLGPGTLYRSIQRLLDDALIEEIAVDDAPASDERRTYRFTALGRRVACAEAARLATLVRAARRRGLLDAPAPARRRGATP